METNNFEGNGHPNDELNVNSLLNLNGLQNVLNKMLFDLSELKQSQKLAEARQQTKASNDTLQQLQLRVDGELKNIKRLGVRTSNAVSLEHIELAEMSLLLTASKFIL
mmetsp:Transcript_14761/g.17281  ORF Transcript_14761/g.17281 Transcript_14761/m.17281 type:complete len:108 (+) Transcript_14761:282-605(+)